MAFVDTEQRPAGEVQQKVGRIKLSEAIRIGARIRPQCTGRYFSAGGSCAMGAAMEASGILYRDGADTPPEAVPMLPELFKKWGEYTPLAETIYKKNDDEGWSRERIADWLEAQGL